MSSTPAIGPPVVRCPVLSSALWRLRGLVIPCGYTQPLCGTDVGDTANRHTGRHSRDPRISAG
eukprot:522579-Rhodomonas_salina.5